MKALSWLCRWYALRYPGAAFACHVIGADIIVAVEIRYRRINKGVAFDLTENRRAVAPSFPRLSRN